MAKLVFEGPLSRYYGKSLEVNETSIQGVLKKLIELGIVDQKGRVKPGYIVLVNDVDIRVIGDKALSRDDVIRVIPINHGG